MGVRGHPAARRTDEAKIRRLTAGDAGIPETADWAAAREMRNKAKFGSGPRRNHSCPQCTTLGRVRNVSD